MFRTIFSTLGMAMAFLMPNWSCSFLRTSLLYCSFSLAAMSLHLRVALAAVARAAGLGAVLAGARGLAAARADHLEVRDLDGGLALQDASLDVALRVGPGVLLAEVDALHDGRPLGRVHAQHLPLFAAVLAGKDEDRVVLLDVRLEIRLLFLGVCSSVHQM